MEWLAGDVEGNFVSMTESIRQADGADCVWSYWGWIEHEVKEYFVCRAADPEELLVGLYNYFFATVGYFEPSFKLFERKLLCQLFDFCDKGGENYGNLKDIIEASKVKEAMIEIYTPIVQVKQAIICNSNHVLKTYWEYVLF